MASTGDPYTSQGLGEDFLEEVMLELSLERPTNKRKRVVVQDQEQHSRQRKQHTQTPRAKRAHNHFKNNK